MTCYTEEELKKLQVLLSTLLGAQYDDIVVCGLQNGCVIVTFMIRKCLIPKLRELYTSEKENLICQWMFKLSLKYKVVRVMIEEDEVFMCGMIFFLMFNIKIRGIMFKIILLTIFKFF